MKTCKQCGRYLDESAFQRYVPRGKGIYNTTQGTHTICKECESFNRTVNYAYKASPRNVEQQEIVDQAMKIYKRLISMGYHPVGALARSMQEPSKPNGALGRVLQYERVVAPDTGQPTPVVKLLEMLETTITDENIAEFKDDYELYEDQLCSATVGPLPDDYEKLLACVFDRIREFEHATQ